MTRSSRNCRRDRPSDDRADCCADDLIVLTRRVASRFPLTGSHNCGGNLSHHRWSDSATPLQPCSVVRRPCMHCNASAAWCWLRHDRNDGAVARRVFFATGAGAESAMQCCLVKLTASIAVRVKRHSVGLVSVCLSICPSV